MATDNPEKPAPSKNGPNAAILSTLASSSNMWVQLATVGLVAVSGFSNWAATWKSADNNRQEIVSGQEKIRAEVIRQVQDIHDWIKSSSEEFHKGNEDSAANRKILNQIMREDLDAFERRQQALLGNQNQMMVNQSKILENDSVVIQEIHNIVEKFEKWKKAEQLRGAPP